MLGTWKSPTPRALHPTLQRYDRNGDVALDEFGEVPFAPIDPALDHLTTRQCELVEHSSQIIRSLKDALHAVTLTGREAKSLVARSRGKLYLAGDRGRKVIRELS